MKIEKPQWQSNGYIHNPEDPDIALEFDEWFEKYVEPINKILSEGVEVYAVGENPDGQATSRNWHLAHRASDTHKAILIKIQPLKKESAKDVLRDIIEEYKPYPDLEKHDSFLAEAIERAKAVLEKK